MKKLVLPIFGSCTILSCSLFNGSNSYPTIPLPPQKPNASGTASMQGLVKYNSSRTVSASAPKANTNQRTITEERSNGEVTQIKVDNGSTLPDYYMYPSQQQNLNTNSTPDKNLSTPSWQINW